LPLLYLAAMFLLNGCATVPPKLAYPALKAGEAACVLRLENTISEWDMLAGWRLGMDITVDGFLPVEQTKLSRGRFLTKGNTEISLPVGNHVLVHQACILTGGLYRFNPVTMSFETEAGKTYVVRFKNTSSMVKPRYGVEYEGWGSEQTAQWPNTVTTANAIFGR
jgi:hypothetical protein